MMVLGSYLIRVAKAAARFSNYVKALRQVCLPVREGDPVEPTIAVIDDLSPPVFSSRTQVVVCFPGVGPLGSWVMKKLGQIKEGPRKEKVKEKIRGDLRVW